MYFDGTGFCIWTKRLAKKGFACLWTEMKEQKIKLSQRQLQGLLQGFSLKRILLQQKGG
jgi:hypothetical protein